MMRSQGIPAWVDFACTSKRKADFALPARSSVNRVHWALPVRRAIASQAVADEIDVDVFVGRPMALEIVEEGRPIELQVVPPTE